MSERAESVDRTVYLVKGSRIERGPVFAQSHLKALHRRFPIVDSAPLPLHLMVVPDYL